MTQPVHGQVEHVNPDGLHKNPAFTQMAIVSGPVKTVYVGAQWAVNKDGTIVGKGDIAVQTAQILSNIDACLEAAGGQREQIIHMSVFVAEGQDMRPAFETAMHWWGRRPNPPMNNVMYVSGFGTDDILLAIEAMAIIPL